MDLALSIKGGGDRGIIPVYALIALEQQTGKKVRDIFSFVGGTSTGAALTALIQSGVSMTDALEFYTGDDAKKVFNPQDPVLSWEHRIVHGYAYDPKVLDGCLRTALGPCASWTINDCPNDVLIVAVDMTRKPRFFVKDGPKNKQLLGKSSLVEAAVASCAAPTYFKFPNVSVDGKSMPMGDGGTAGFSGPAFRVAKEMFKYGDYDPADTHIISLGTGFYSYPDDTPAPSGLISTIGFATGTLVGAAEDLADDDLRDMYPQCKYDVFNPALPSDIDEADLSAIPTLVKIGQEAASKLDWKSILGL